MIRRFSAAMTCAAGVLAMGTLAGAQALGLRVNTTSSMPMGLWRVEPVAGEMRRGDIVTVCPPDAPSTRQAAARGYISTGPCPGSFALLVKPLAAVAGDVVTVTPAGISVNGEAQHGTAQLDKDSAGRDLQPVQAGVYQVPASRVWLLSGHDARSFDSRYFGPVPVENVQAVARPVWVR